MEKLLKLKITEEQKVMDAVLARHRALVRMLGKKHSVSSNIIETGFGYCDCYEVVIKQWMLYDFGSVAE